MIESKRYEQLRILREHWLNEGELDALSDDDLLDLSDLYETDSEFRAFCDADKELQAALQCLNYFAAPGKSMRDYFYRFRDFCSGKGKIPDSPDSILLFYHASSLFKDWCDADPAVRAMIERWFRCDDPDPVVRAFLKEWLNRYSARK